MNELNKDLVLQRLLTNASEMWGFKGKEVVDLDPIVKVLLGSCAKEFEKIGNELINTEQRVISRLADYILPDVYTGIKPAHAILQATPVDSRLDITAFHRWKYEYAYRLRPESQEEASVKVVFSPARCHSLTSARVLGGVDQKGTFTCSEGVSTAKEHISELTSAPSNEVWCAIKKKNADAGSLEFYFDWPNRTDKRELTRMLEFARCFDVNGKSIPTRIGYDLPEENEGRDFGHLMSAVEIIEEEVAERYKRHFLTIDVNGLSNQPLTLGNEVVDVDDKDVLWVRFAFPSYVDPNHTSDLVILLNCFPVINRDIESQVFRLSGDSNIRSLNTEGYFLEIESLLSQSGFEYVPNPSIGSGTSTKGTYMVRGKEIGRFDTRQALELINHTLDQVKDEYVAFSSMDVDAISIELKTLRTALQRIYKLQPREQAKIQNPFVVVYPKDKTDTVHLSYWTMSGVDSSRIKSGLELEAVEVNQFIDNAGKLITNPIGQNTDVSPKKRIELMRSAVLSRGRIVTSKDLEQRCRSLFGDAISAINITKGVVVSELPGQGLMRCIYVDVVRANQKMDQSAWDDLCAQVEFVLKNESSFVHPIIIRQER